MKNVNVFVVYNHRTGIVISQFKTRAVAERWLAAQKRSESLNWRIRETSVHQAIAAQYREV
jgi:hypothetical protein